MAVYRASNKIAARKLAALGNLCIHWSFLEQRVEQVIWMLQGKNRKAGRKITSYMTLQPRLDRMVKEAKKRFPDKKSATEIEAARKSIKLLAFERNWAVHGLWAYGLERGDKRKTYTLSYFKDPDGNALEMTEAYLHDLAARVLVTARLLERYITKKIGAPLP